MKTLLDAIGFTSFLGKDITINWIFGVGLITIICLPRFILVLNANQTGSYSLIGLIMFFSLLVPFIFLSKKGRVEAGITKTKKYKWLLAAMLVGIISSVILYVLGKVLYGSSMFNWYAYIGQSYNIPENISASDKLVMFYIMAGTGMIFSPLGVEFFFRGIVHSSFSQSLGNKKASLIDSAAFALTYIAHFGLVFVNNQWQFYFIPALIWTLSMFGVSKLFFYFKQKNHSIWGAVLCHSGFNLGMIYTIFYLL